MNLPGRGGVPQPGARLDQEAVPLPRGAPRARPLGLGADVASRRSSACSTTTSTCRTSAQVAWRLLANLDPKRDLAFVDGPIDQLDHGANQALWGSKVCIDGTRKWREEGYAREWPEPCRVSARGRRRASTRCGPSSGSATPRRDGTRRADGERRARGRGTDRSASLRGGAREHLARRARERARSPTCAPAAARRRRTATPRARMFERIAPTYDTLNRLMSAGIDRRWRARAVAELARRAPRARCSTSARARWTSPRCSRARARASASSRSTSPRAMLEAGRHKAPRAEVVVADATRAALRGRRVRGRRLRLRHAQPRRSRARARARCCACSGRAASSSTLELFRPTRLVTRAFHRAYARVVLPAVGGLALGRPRRVPVPRAEHGGLPRRATSTSALLADVGFARTCAAAT